MMAAWSFLEAYQNRQKEEEKTRSEIELQQGQKDQTSANSTTNGMVFSRQLAALGYQM